MKAQALADFMAEIASTLPEIVTPFSLCDLYVDSSFSQDSSGAGLIIKSPQGKRQEHALEFMFKASNNEARYEALIATVKLYYRAGAESVRVFSVSLLENMK